MKGLEDFGLLVTDYVRGNSLFTAVGDMRVFEEAFNTRLWEDEWFVLRGVVSRKAQVIPNILRVIEEIYSRE